MGTTAGLSFFSFENIVEWGGSHVKTQSTYLNSPSNFHFLYTVKATRMLKFDENIMFKVVSDIQLKFSYLNVKKINNI